MRNDYRSFSPSPSVATYVSVAAKIDTFCIFLKYACLLVMSLVRGVMWPQNCGNGFLGNSMPWFGNIARIISFQNINRICCLMQISNTRIIPFLPKFIYTEEVNKRLKLRDDEIDHGCPQWNVD